MIFFGKCNNIKIYSHSFSRTIGNLKMITKVMIGLLNKWNIRKASLQIIDKLLLICLLIKNNGIGLLAISSCPTGFLIIGLQRIGQIEMNHKPYIGFINSHPKRICSYNNANNICHPSLLFLIPFLPRKPSMIIIC
ncbi:hypothetical protein D3C72_1580700 [compost metagenome]